MLFTDPDQINVTGVIAFDPTYYPFHAGPQYLRTDIVAELISGDTQPLTHGFFLERDAWLLRGRVAAEILPLLASRYSVLGEDGQLLQVESTAQDIKNAPESGALCVVIPRGLWPVAQHLLHIRGYQIKLPESRLEPGRKLNLPAASPLRRVLKHIRHEPRGRFIIHHGNNDIADIVLATACRWPDRQVVLVIRSKKERKSFEQAIHSSLFPSAAYKSKPIMVLTPEELWKKAERCKINYRKSIIFVADPTSVATQRMAYCLGHMCQARLYTFEQLRLHSRPYEPFVDTRIACFFGLQRITLAPPLKFIRCRTKLAQGEATSAFAAKRDYVWNSAARNQFVAKLAGNRFERLMPASQIAILVENDVHRDQLLPLIAAHDSQAAEQIHVFTFRDVIPWESLDVLIRADATAGIPGCFRTINVNRTKALTLIDLCDQSQPVLGQMAAERRRAYRQWLPQISPGTLEEAVAAYLARHSKHVWKKENQNGRV